MDSIDGTEHYERASDEPPPSLLTIILDTNPYAWALLADTLPLSKALANLLVFINAHLALNYANKVAVIASHIQRAEFLYPSQNPLTPPQATNGLEQDEDLYNGDSDVEMLDGPLEATVPDPKKKKSKANINDTQPPSLPRSNTKHATDDANKYRPFRLISEALLASLTSLVRTTSPSSITATPTTSIAGALTLALTYINKQSLSSSLSGPSGGQTNPNVQATDLDDKRIPTLQSRILILSVSGDLAAQYIPLMNCIFASQRLSIPIDICKISGDTVFLQQASDATQGIYIKLDAPRGLLQYLMMGFLPDQGARRWLVGTGAGGVDLRAACFCHRRVVGLGWVCSVCLSIFCEVPPDRNCLTCGTHLSLAESGGKLPAVGGRRKKKKRKVVGGGGGTPVPG
ncbi:MAG: General transcription factor IIH subunit 3 [Icmadophila ericetorum]|nr:General transcription factor IIH subunit 3 [Icmadophila ericetorum]